jgi:hypothetical protein
MPMPGRLRDQRHLLLLAAMLLLLVLQPFLTGVGVATRIVSAGLMLGVVLCAFLAALYPGRERWVAAALATPGIAIELTHYAFPQHRQLVLAIVLHISFALFLAYVAAALLRHAFHRRHLAVDDIVGTFTGYLMLGLCWSQMYAIVWLLAPDAFSIAPQIAWQLDEWHTRRALFTYFSFATQASVGYADVTTTAPASNTLAWMEVLLAQFYLAVVVAAIVGMKLADAVRSERSD